MEVTNEDYLKNRIKVEKEYTLWDTEMEDNITPDMLISRIERVKNSILSNCLCTDESSMYLSIYGYCGGGKIIMYNEQWETIDEYERRLTKEESLRKSYLSTLKGKMRENFEDACRILEELKSERERDGKGC